MQASRKNILIQQNKNTCYNSKPKLLQPTEIKAIPDSSEKRLIQQRKSTCCNSKPKLLPQAYYK
jgi:hypothetical protein